MNRSFSVYLDIVRFIAAMLVFVSHVPAIAGGTFWQIGFLGHEAVVVFFLMSGFVIAYVVYDKGESPLRYTANRLARMYSVALPALLLSIAVYYIGLTVAPEAIASAQSKMQEPVETALRAVTFTNQSWSAYSTFANQPYWSMGYEVWYYILFGVAIFMQGWARLIAAGGCMLIMGPSIMLYLPIWWAGVWCFQYREKYQVSRITALFTLLLSTLLFAVLCQDDIQQIFIAYTMDINGGPNKWLLPPAEHILVDIFLTIAATVHLLSVYRLSQFSWRYTLPQRIATGIQHVAAHTFALYLLHMPLLYLVAIFLPHKTYGWINVLSCVVLVPAVVYGISQIIERRRYALRVRLEGLLHQITLRAAH